MLGKIEGGRTNREVMPDIVSQARLKLKYTFKHNELNRDPILFLNFPSHYRMYISIFFMFGSFFCVFYIMHLSCGNLEIFIYIF